MLLCLLFGCIASWLASLYSVNGCSVIPSSAAVVAGNDLSLTCTTQSRSEYVNSWRLESDANSARVLYQAPSLAPDGSIIVERKVADGYLVNDSNPNVQVILTIVKASTDQANYYFCLCTGSTSSFAYVSVLASEPTFSNTTEIIDGQSVIFSCSVSFNGAANASMSIEDSSGTSLNKSSYDGTSKGLHNFSLNSSVTANSKAYQGYFCNIRLSNDTSNTVIYSRKRSASVQWVSVRNVQISPIDSTQCLDGDKCSIDQKIRCTAKGNPKPSTFQWLTSVNGSGFLMTGTSGDQFTFTNTGRYEVQCIAFNEITGTRYNSSSSIFKTEVVIERLDFPASEKSDSASINLTGLIVGLVVGLGGSVIVIITIIALAVKFCKSKKKRQQNKAEVYTTLDVQSSVTSGTPQQDLYTELQTSPVNQELQNGHRVNADTYETVIQ